VFFITFLEQINVYGNTSFSFSFFLPSFLPSFHSFFLSFFLLEVRLTEMSTGGSSDEVTEREV
jgi:hypothetical protein